MSNRLLGRVTKDINDTYTFVMSSDCTDRVGDIVEPEALAAAANQEKLIALWAHDDTKPIGFWQNLRVEAGKLLGDLVLAPTNLSKMLTALLDAGTPLGASIGFTGSGAHNGQGRTYDDIQLLECSIVSIPCNPESVQIAKQFGLDHYLSDQSGVAEDTLGASALLPEEVIRRAKMATLSANQIHRRINKL